MSTGSKFAALIPAAGVGERLGRGPKALVVLAGKTLLARSVEAFIGQVDETVVAVPADLVANVHETYKGLRVIEGAASRQATVYALLKATDAESVLIHDAARPFLSPKLIEAVIAAVRRHGAASPALPVTDTLVRDESGSTVAREGLQAIQTPQGFRRDLLLEAHERARSMGKMHTDDASLVRDLGREVRLVPGSSWLMKVTTPADLELAEALAPAWDARQAR